MHQSSTYVMKSPPQAFLITNPHYRILTENPHIAGRSVDEEDLVDFISTRFKKAGLVVETHPYDVLLSYPDDSDSNFVAIQKDDGNGRNCCFSSSTLVLERIHFGGGRGA